MFRSPSKRADPPSNISATSPSLQLMPSIDETYDGIAEGKYSSPAVVSRMTSNFSLYYSRNRLDNTSSRRRLDSMQSTIADSNSSNPPQNPDAADYGSLFPDPDLDSTYSKKINLSSETKTDAKNRVKSFKISKSDNQKSGTLKSNTSTEKYVNPLYEDIGKSKTESPPSTLQRMRLSITSTFGSLFKSKPKKSSPGFDEISISDAYDHEEKPFVADTDDATKISRSIASEGKIGNKPANEGVHESKPLWAQSFVNRAGTNKLYGVQSSSGNLESADEDDVLRISSSQDKGPKNGDQSVVKTPAKPFVTDKQPVLAHEPSNQMKLNNASPRKPTPASPTSTFSPEVGPMESTFAKHSSIAFVANDLPRGTSSNTSPGENRNMFIRAIAKMVQLDGGFNTVYSVDPQTRPSIAFDPSVSSRHSHSHSHSGSADSGSEKLPGRSKGRKGTVGLDGRMHTSGRGNPQGTEPSALEENLRNMGIANRQEGGMDMESALLIVLMDPTHPYGQMFGPKSEIGNVYDIALRANETEIERLSNELSNEHPDVIALKAATADLYKGLDMPLAAEVLLRQVLDSQTRVLGNAHADVLSSMNDLGLLMVSTQRYAEAQAMFEEVVSAVCRTQGEAHPDAAAALGNLAVALRMQRNFANAIPVHERAVLILEQATGVGRNHPDAAYQRSLMGVTYMCMGAEQRGKRIVQEALIQLEDIHNLNASHPWVLALKSVLDA